MVEISTQDFTIAGQWLETFATPLRAPDALHLAAAFSLREPLWTADQALAKSVATLGIQHRLIE